MPRFKNIRMEEFCRLMAKTDLTPAEAAFKAGYGESYDKIAPYHGIQANRLMEREEILIRIEELKDGMTYEDIEQREEMIARLKSIFLHDPTKYFRYTCATMRDGRGIQSVSIKPEYANFDKWSDEDRRMVDHFDPKTGVPIFVSKTWAGDKLLRILQLDGSNATTSTIEDITNLFQSAGLTVGRKEDFVGYGDERLAKDMQHLEEDDEEVEF